MYPKSFSRSSLPAQAQYGWISPAEIKQQRQGATRTIDFYFRRLSLNGIWACMHTKHTTNAKTHAQT